MITGVSDLQLGAAGLVMLGIIALATGVLVPRWTVKQLMAALREAITLKDQQLTQKDEEIKLWKEAAKNNATARDQAIENAAVAIEVGRLNTKVLHALTAGSHQGEADDQSAKVEASTAS